MLVRTLTFSTLLNYHVAVQDYLDFHQMAGAGNKNQIG